MERSTIIPSAIALAASFTPAHAQFSEEWNLMADQIKSECESFSDSIAAEEDTYLVVADALKFPAHPGPPSRPYACIFLRFDINASGETENIEAVFKSPDNLRYAFTREVINAAKRWKFVVPAEAPDGLTGNYARMDYIPLAGYRYQGNIRLQAG